MNERWVRRVGIVFFAINLIAIIAAAISGHLRGQLAFRFEEKQAITFISSNQLGATALLAWIVFLLRDRLQDAAGIGRRMHYFWGISAAGFLYLMIDESFQLHEGMDTAVFRLFGSTTDPMIDGAATLAYGLLAASVCYHFRSEITRYGQTLRLFLLGGVFLVLTSVLNAGEPTQLKIVLEETAKLLGVVSFLLGHLSAFAGVVREVRRDQDTGPAAARPRLRL